MKLETRNTIFSKLDSNYALVRDEDWEVLCLLWRDDEWYFALYMEHYNLSKVEATQILDRSAWVALIPVIEEKAKKQYQENLEKAKDLIEEQLELMWSEE